MKKLTSCWFFHYFTNLLLLDKDKVSNIESVLEYLHDDSPGCRPLSLTVFSLLNFTELIDRFVVLKARKRDL